MLFLGDIWEWGFDFCVDGFPLSVVQRAVISLNLVQLLKVNLPLFAIRIFCLHLHLHYCD